MKSIRFVALNAGAISALGFVSAFSSAVRRMTGCLQRGRVSPFLGAILTVVLPSAFAQDISPAVCDGKVTLTRQRLFPGFDGKTCKVVPSVAVDGNGIALMTFQELKLTGSDEFYGQYVTRSCDAGETWSPPVRQDALADSWEGTNRLSRSSITIYHNFRKGRWFAVGQEAVYLGGNRGTLDSVGGRPAGVPIYISVDAEKAALTGFKTLPFPFDYSTALPFGQIVECDNGEMIIPFYFSENSDPKHRGRCVCVRYAFCDDGLVVVKVGKPVADDTLRRGLAEPSLVEFRGRYYLTLRSDERGLYAESADGLVFSQPKTWSWEDGTPIGNRNTQQHWIRANDDLFLSYTRERADNRHVFRNRAPVFMARFDPAHGRLVRDSEFPLVPELGARLGNFCCCPAAADVTWLVTAEWMQPDGCARYGSDNSIWLVKVKSAFGK